MTDRPAWWSSDEWATPPDFVAAQAQRIGVEAFTLDPCCRRETAKAPTFYTRAENGLQQSWSGCVWVNPPYSDIGPWLRKARQEQPRYLVACVLIPAATDVGWFHDEVLAGGAEVYFVRGRLRFLGWEGTPIPSPRTPSLVVTYWGRRG